MTARRLVILSAALILVAVLFAAPATPGNVASVIVGAVCGANMIVSQYGFSAQASQNS